VTLRDQIDQRNSEWRLFHEWEAEQPPITREPSAILADLGSLLQWCTPELIGADPDPDKRGIAKMRAALALISTE
jgi:hypothetical protein